jgi:hypothetical protein
MIIDLFGEIDAITDQGLVKKSLKKGSQDDLKREFLGDNIQKIVG